jgi:nitrate/nitrite transporter NarK
MRTLAIVLAVIFLVLMVFYLIPGVYHPFTSTATHVKHAVLFLALAVLCFIGARFASSSAATR